MSLYNLVHGVNPMAGVLLAALGITSTAQIPRFRDCYWTGQYIALYTRTGGGNRDYYDSPIDNTDNTTGPWNSDLRALDGFSHDEDDEFDSTYATFYFTPAPVIADALRAVPAADATPAQRTQDFLNRLTSGAPDPQVARVMDALAPTIEAIKKAVAP